MHVFRINEFGERPADHFVDGATNAFGPVSIDREDDTLEVVGADHAERAFDELTVAGFALANGSFSYPLDGDVEAGRNKKFDLVLGINQRRRGP